MRLECLLLKDCYVGKDKKGQKTINNASLINDGIMGLNFDSFDSSNNVDDLFDDDDDDLIIGTASSNLLVIDPDKIIDN